MKVFPIRMGMELPIVWIRKSVMGKIMSAQARFPATNILRKRPLSPVACDWLDMGTKEGRARGHVTPTLLRTRRLVDIFDAAGLAPGRDYYYSEIAGGEHNEAAWAARFNKMLLYFFAR